jgi:hypothetical protein
VKVRFTSGTGSEALMGYAQGMSMLYLEARCLAVVRRRARRESRTARSRASRSSSPVPGGTRAILGENVLAAWLDLEVASGNDAIASHSEIRKTAKLMGQFLPGTDFVTSGYSVMPRHDNTFGGGNYDADDLDEWLTIQRDWQVDAGIEPVSEDELLRVRERGARAVQAVFAELELPEISDAEVEAATTGYDAREMPDRDRAADVEAADELLGRGVSGLDVALALDRTGFGDVAEAVLGMQRQARRRRLPPDLGGHRRRRARPLGGQRSERVLRAGTGYRLEGERWELLQSLPQVVGSGRAARRRATARPIVAEVATRQRGDDAARSSSPSGPRSPTRSAGRSPISTTATCSTRSATDPRSGGDAAPRSCAPRGRRRVHRARRRAALRLRRRASASSRRARRSSTAPISSRSTTSSSSGCRRCTRSSRTGRWGETRPANALGQARRPRADAARQLRRGRSSSSARRCCTAARRRRSSRARAGRARARCRATEPGLARRPEP